MSSFQIKGLNEQIMIFAFPLPLALQKNSSEIDLIGIEWEISVKRITSRYLPSFETWPIIPEELNL